MDNQHDTLVELFNMLSETMWHQRKHSTFLVVALVAAFVSAMWYSTWPGFKTPQSYAWWGSEILGAAMVLLALGALLKSAAHLGTANDVARDMTGVFRTALSVGAISLADEEKEKGRSEN